MTFDEMIAKLLDNGIEIVLKKEDGVVWYDLQTGMKSELLIAKSPNPGGDETAISKGRYGHEGSIDTWSIPFVQPTYTAKIKDEDYPEKDGKYYVTGVTTAINESGFKRTVKIGIKVSV